MSSINQGSYKRKYWQNVKNHGNFCKYCKIGIPIGQEFCRKRHELKYNKKHGIK